MKIKTHIDVFTIISPEFNVKRHSEQKKMNREITEITDLALANLLDVIQLLSNTEDEIDPILIDSIILRIYERNAAVLEQN